MLLTMVSHLTVFVHKNHTLTLVIMSYNFFFQIFIDIIDTKTVKDAIKPVNKTKPKLS